MYPPQYPGSIGGQLESKINELRQELSNKAWSHDVSSLSSHVDRLERSVQKLRSEIDELRNRLEEVFPHYN